MMRRSLICFQVLCSFSRDNFSKKQWENAAKWQATENPRNDVKLQRVSKSFCIVSRYFVPKLFAVWWTDKARVNLNVRENI